MKYIVFTYGCQMNISESERIKTILNNLELEEIKDENDVEKADVVVLNSCSVRESAENRVFGLTNKIDKLRKKNNKKQLIVVTGCMAGRDKNGSIRRKFKNKIDVLMKIKDIKNLPTIIREFFTDTLEEEKLNHDDTLEYLSIVPTTKNNYQVFIPIMSGCNNFCTYCAVPFSRGREQSRNMEDILAEVQKFKDKGYKEVTLLGQNVNSYNPEKSCISKDNPYTHKFAQLLWEVNKIGIPRIYFTSSHPKDLDDEVIDALTLENMGNYLHLAVQSGDDEIIRQMNRHYTAEQYLNLVKKIREKNPDLAIGTDIIVGFPGESEEAFQNTCKLYRAADFDISYNAIYSDRSGTASQKMKNKIPFETKRRRWNELHKIMEEVVLKKNQKYLNQTVSVLVETKGNKYWEGRSSEQKLVKFPIKENEDYIGQIVNVKINKVEEWNLYGEIEK